MVCSYRLFHGQQIGNGDGASEFLFEQGRIKQQSIRLRGAGPVEGRIVERRADGGEKLRFQKARGEDWGGFQKSLRAGDERGKPLRGGAGQVQRRGNIGGCGFPSGFFRAVNARQSGFREERHGDERCTGAGDGAVGPDLLPKGEHSRAFISKRCQREVSAGVGVQDVLMIGPA